MRPHPRFPKHSHRLSCWSRNPQKQNEQNHRRPPNQCFRKKRTLITNSIPSLTSILKHKRLHNIYASPPTDATTQTLHQNWNFCVGNDLQRGDWKREDVSWKNRVVYPVNVVIADRRSVGRIAWSVRNGVNLERGGRRRRGGFLF